MSPKAATLPPNEPAMWRKLLAANSPHTRRRVSTMPGSGSIRGGSVTDQWDGAWWA